MLAVEAVMVYGADKSFSKSKITLLLSVVAAFALGVIGVVSVKEWHLVHNGERRRDGGMVFRHIGSHSLVPVVIACIRYET